MTYRRLGNSGLFLSSFSLGSWVTFKNQVNVKSAIEMMSYAYDQGVNFFDNAEIYADGESEEIMGDALKKMNWSRDSYLVSSKVFWGGEKPTQRGLSRKHVIEGCDNALKRFKLDYLDLYYCHRPDVDTPIIETLRAMHTLIMQGKILYWGTSEWSAEQITEAYTLAERYHLTPPTVEQPQYNLLHRERVEKEYSGLYEKYGMGTTTWSPLSSGILTGKYGNGIPEGSRLSLDKFSWLKEMYETPEGKMKLKIANELQDLAVKRGISLAQLSLAWCLKNPNVSSVILGASRLEQLEDNLKSLDVLHLLDTELMEEIEVITNNRPEPHIDWKKH
ncbi:aldo/keto reductase [Halobacteriovorax sp. JY17]|uniref:potassium channel beta subunit family protein n=1 Tax=Halobacteriovorax sp. JY17 TaxID=2014617 RepID=UPI000C570F30|nr:MAG: aldo/keto reductase [Halobacteriovorax sp. JY17]